MRRELAREKNIVVSLRTVERAVVPLWRELVVGSHDRQVAFEWMRAILQKDISLDVLRSEIGDVPENHTLLERLYEGRLSDRNRAMVVLANGRGLSTRLVCDFLGIDRKTRRKYVRSFNDGGCEALFSRQVKVIRKTEDERLKQAVFGLLHEPPSNYDINRTTWIMSDLTRVLRETGNPACADVVRKITKAAGYRWRKARIALTSSDPDYSDKLDHIRSILSKLRSDEAFFSIDEFGPFAVKMKPGRMLTAPGEQRVVPQWQRSKGRIIMTAALELSSNQVTHFYSPRKNTTEMIRMMECLLQKYGDRHKLYLSWDAASWHISKSLNQRVLEHNAAILSDGHGPTVEAAPLPAGAQFLNVIESVFSGMARSIIHNSDYKSLDDAKTAIDRYFAERNAHFSLHPRKAGKRIWGKEREVAEFSAANNCKDPRYR
jgi:transposase